MKTGGQRNLKLLGGQGKTDKRPDRETSGWTDKLIPVYPPPLTTSLCGDVQIICFSEYKMATVISYFRKNWIFEIKK
jgi:hypothetical protein